MKVGKKEFYTILKFPCTHDCTYAYRLHYIITSTIDRKKIQAINCYHLRRVNVANPWKSCLFPIKCVYVFRQRSNKNTQKKNIEHGSH